ncbi:amino acid ABC transporter permease [Neptunicoccus cionae]|uniref:Polar amino acid ABC transporter permease n=1 Tax=Neptunicoccus cionae TaxID=2035344 RepID=A0A916R092_9RHOB|nr:amino acid ABC transporter permease [Amylibacter cionae]GGA25182.1 polar amino acid ABC transporter permease [Amylibacter cionae]
MASAKRRTLKGFLNAAPVAIGLYIVVIFGIFWLAFNGAQAMGYNWQWYRMPQYFYRLTEDGFQWGEIVIGLMKTIQLSATAFFFATLLGLIVALLRLSGLVVGTAVAVAFLEFVRNMPILVLLYLFYYVLGPIFKLDRYTASILCLAVFHAALISEIFRAGINSVPKGQWEGATSIGMTKSQAYRYIVLPQSVKFMLPPMTGELVHLVKSSAIVSVIAVAELTTIGRNLISDTYMSFEIWFTIAVVYLILTLALSIGVTRIEKKFAVQN